MKTSEIRAILDCPIKNSDTTNAGILRIATEEETLSGESLPVAVTPNTNLLLSGYRNKIINGDMSLWTRNGETVISPANNTFLADRWRINYNGTMQVDIKKHYDTTFYNPDISCLRITCTVADPSIASNNYFLLTQPIEGTNIKAFKDNPIAVSFYARSSMTGTFCVSLRLYGTDNMWRNYIIPYQITQANTWKQYKTTAIPSFNDGGFKWNAVYNTSLGMQFSVALMTGTSLQNSNTGWIKNANTFYSTTSQSNFFASTGITFDISEVQIEPGLAVTPYDYLPITVNEILCKRYYEKGVFWEVYYWNKDWCDIYNTYYASMIRFTARKRVVPTMSGTFSSAGWNSTQFYFDKISDTECMIRTPATTTNTGLFSTTVSPWKADAEL